MVLEHLEDSLHLWVVRGQLGGSFHVIIEIKGVLTAVIVVGFSCPAVQREYSKRVIGELGRL